jgi:hypothetical protein
MKTRFSLFAGTAFALVGNFENNDFKFDVVMHGPQITTGITF